MTLWLKIRDLNVVSNRDIERDRLSEWGPKPLIVRDEISGHGRETTALFASREASAAGRLGSSPLRGNEILVGKVLRVLISSKLVSGQLPRSAAD